MDSDLALKKLGLLFRKVRHQRGLTQAQLAALIDKDQQTVQRLETGRHNPSYVFLLQYCKGLDIELIDLLQTDVK